MPSATWRSGSQRAALLLKFRRSQPDAGKPEITLPAGWTASGEPTSLPADQVARAEAVFRKLVEIAAENQIEVTFVNLDPNHEENYLGQIDPRARYLDLGPLLAEQAKHRSIGFKYDAHFNPEANALIGRELIEFVRDPAYRG